MLVWSQNLSTGNDQIDDQHKELFDRINKLIEAMKAGKGRDVIEETFKFVNQYLVVHFGTEERLMTAHKYPEYDSHKKQHESFTNQFKDLKTRLDKEGVTSTIVVETQPLLVDWWYNHVNKVDKLLGAFLKDKK
jgi:hemerythrin